MSKLNISVPDLVDNLNKSFWASGKKKEKLIDSACQLGKKLDAVAKLLTPLKKITDIFPVDTALPDWSKQALKLKANKSKYTTPAINALDDLITSLESEYKRKERAAEVTKHGAKHPLKQLSVFATIQRKRITDFIERYESEAIPQIQQERSEEYYSDFRKNLGRLVSEKVRSKNFEINGGEINVTFSILDMGGDNPFVTQFFQDGLGDLVDDAVVEIVDLINEYEKRLARFQGKGAIIEKVLRDIKAEGQGEIDAITTRLNRELPLEVDKLHEKMQKMKSSYKVYKKKVVVKIAKTSFDVLASAAGTAVSGAAIATGGGSALGIAGLVLSCRGLVKNAVALGKAVEQASKSATAMGKQVQASLKKQAEAFRKEAASMAKKDAAKVILNNITDFAVGVTFTTTLEELIEKCDVWLNKTYGVFEHSRKLAKPLNACIEAAAQLEVMVSNDEKKLKSNPPADAKVKKKAEDALDDAKKNLEKLRKQLDELLKKITKDDFYSNIRGAEKSMVQLKALQKLRQQTIPPGFDKAVGYIRIVADAIDTIAGAVVGGFDFASSEKAALDIAGLALGAGDLLKGVAESGKAIKDAASGK